MRTSFFVLVSITVLAGGPCFAELSAAQQPEVQSNATRLVQEKKCPGCNLTGAALSRADLAGADLAWANLAGAKLSLANLAGANLVNANLQGAVLGGADLAKADLRGANLAGAVLEGAYLEGAIMDGAIVAAKTSVDKKIEVSETVYQEPRGASKELPPTQEAQTGGLMKNEITAPAVSNQVSGSGSAAGFGPPPETTPVSDAVPSPDLNKHTAAVVDPDTATRSKQLAPMAEAVVPQDLSEQPLRKGSVLAEAKSAIGGGHDQGALQSMEPGHPQLPSMQEAVVAEQHPSRVAGVPPAPSDAPEQRTDAEKDRETAAGEQEGLVRTTVPQMDQEMPAAVTENQAEPPVAVEAGREDILQEPVTDTKPPQPEEILLSAESRGGGLESPEAEPAGGYGPDTPQKAQQKNQERVERLLDEKRCVACDLSGIDLSGKSLAGADLERANLGGADLRDVNFKKANLKGADLHGANLQGADLRQADLYGADLRGADLTGAMLEKALIDSAELDGAIGAGLDEAIQEE